MNKIYQLIIVLFIALFALSSCFKDDVELDIDELTKIDRSLNFEGPLINAEFNAADLVERMGDSISDYLDVDDDGFMSIKYKDSIHTAWDGIVEIEGVNETINIPFSKKSVDAQTVKKRINMNSSEDQRFDSLTVASAIMTITMTFPDNFTGPVTITFPEITKSGQPLIFEFDAEEGTSTIRENMVGNKIIFNHGTDSSYITMVMTMDLTPTGTPEASAQLIVDFQMTNLVPEVMFGYFGQKRIMDKAQTLNFGFFEDMRVVDLVEFYDIELLIEFNNYFGIPYNGTLADAVVVRNSTNERIELDLNNNTAFVPGAIYAEEVDPTFNSFLYTKDNSNIGDVVNMFPDKIDYRLQIDINPDGEEDINFVTENNSIAGNLYLIIPLWLRTEKYYRYDSIHNFNLIQDRDSSQLEGIQTADLYFTIHNGFPFEIDAQVFVANDNYTIVDSLFNEDQHLLETGILDENDKVIERSTTEVTVNLTSEDLLEFKSKNVSKLILLTKTSTAYNGERFVKIYNNYGVGFELNAKLITSESN